jgi:hypothetical protein
MPRLEEMTLPELIADSMALCKRVAAGLAASSGYQPPEPEEDR